MAHGKWSEVEARAMLEARRRSGLSVAQFAAERRLVPQRRRYWKFRLDGAHRGVAIVGDEELPAVLPARVKGATRGEPVTVLLRSGHMLKVAHGFDEDAFSRVVALLEPR